MNAIDVQELIKFPNAQCEANARRQAANASRLSCEFTVEFDREVNTDHYISPGTMQIEFCDGTVIPFDFKWSVSSINGKCVTFEEQELDLTAYPSSAMLKEYLRASHVSKLEMVYIYTGEADEDPAIKPVKIRDFGISDSVESLKFIADEDLLAGVVLC